MTSHDPDILYPALLLGKDSVYLAHDPLELCAHPRSLFDDTVQRARMGELCLLDIRGNYYKVSDWTRIKPFGGIKGIPLRLLGSVFAAPVLAIERQLPLDDFKRKVARAVHGRYRYDGDRFPAAHITEKIIEANSYEAVIEALPKLF